MIQNVPSHFVVNSTVKGFFFLKHEDNNTISRSNMKKVKMVLSPTLSHAMSTAIIADT